MLINIVLLGCMNENSQNNYIKLKGDNIQYILINNTNNRFWGGYFNNTTFLTTGDLPIQIYENEDIHKLLEKRYNHSIALSDDIYYHTTSMYGGQGSYPFQCFKFHISKDNTKDAVRGIEIIWEGKSYNMYGYENDNPVILEMYMKNNNNSIWEKIFQIDDEIYYEDRNISNQIINNIFNYVDEQQNLYVLVIGPFGEGYCNSELNTDFIEIKWYI